MTTDDVVVDVSQDWVLACHVQQRFMQAAGRNSGSKYCWSKITPEMSGYCKKPSKKAISMERCILCATVSRRSRTSGPARSPRRAAIFTSL